MTDVDDVDWGDMTFGEACDEMVAKATRTIAECEKTAIQLRAAGHVEDAAAIEDDIEELRGLVVDLLETRQQTPFDRLSDEQLSSFAEMYGLDPDILGGEGDD